jgi:hypothetical protein
LDNESKINAHKTINLNDIRKDYQHNTDTNLQIQIEKENEKRKYEDKLHEVEEVRKNYHKSQHQLIRAENEFKESRARYDKFKDQTKHYIEGTTKLIGDKTKSEIEADSNKEFLDLEKRKVSAETKRIEHSKTIEHIKSPDYIKRSTDLAIKKAEIVDVEEKGQILQDTVEATKKHKKAKISFEVAKVAHEKNIPQGVIAMNINEHIDKFDNISQEDVPNIIKHSTKVVENILSGDKMADKVVQINDLRERIDSLPNGIGENLYTEYLKVTNNVNVLNDYRKMSDEEFNNHVGFLNELISIKVDRDFLD